MATHFWQHSLIFQNNFETFEITTFVSMNYYCQQSVEFKEIISESSDFLFYWAFVIFIFAKFIEIL